MFHVLNNHVSVMDRSLACHPHSLNSIFRVCFQLFFFSIHFLCIRDVYLVMCLLWCMWCTHDDPDCVSSGDYFLWFDTQIVILIIFSVMWYTNGHPDCILCDVICKWLSWLFYLSEVILIVVPVIWLIHKRWSLLCSLWYVTYVTTLILVPSDKIHM